MALVLMALARCARATSQRGGIRRGACVCWLCHCRLRAHDTFLTGRHPSQPMLSSRVLSAARDGLLSAVVDLGALLPLSAGQREIDAAQGLLATKQRDALEDARRDGGAGDRHTYRLIDLAWLGVVALDHLRERCLYRIHLEAWRCGELCARVAQYRYSTLAKPALTRRGILGDTREEEARQWPEVSERLDLLLTDRHRALEQLTIGFHGTCRMRIRNT